MSSSKRENQGEGEPSFSDIICQSVKRAEAEPFIWDPEIVVGICTYDLVLRGCKSEEFNRSMGVLHEIAAERGREVVEEAFKKWIDDYADSVRSKEVDIDPALSFKDFKRALAKFEVGLLEKLDPTLT